MTASATTKPAVEIDEFDFDRWADTLRLFQSIFMTVGDLATQNGEHTALDLSWPALLRLAKTMEGDLATLRGKIDTLMAARVTR